VRLINFLKDHRPRLRTVMIVGCLGLIGLTVSAIILFGLYLGAIPRNFDVVFDLSRRFMVAGALVSIVGVLISILIASKITAPVHAIIERTERSRAGRKGVFNTLLRTPITVEHKQLMQSVSAMVKELERREEYAKYFASHVVHELSNPLSAIKGALEILKDDQFTMSPDERQQFIDIIENNLSTLTGLVDELHSQTRDDRLLGANTFEIDLQEIRSTVSGYFPNNQIDIQVDAESDRIKSTLSSIALESIIRSLIGNSIKHCGQEVSVAVTLRAIMSPEKQLQIDVADDGSGIPDSIKKQIFEEFFTTDLDRTSGGMGLANVKKLLEASSGSIALIESSKGSTFRLSIPILETF